MSGSNVSLTLAVIFRNEKYNLRGLMDSLTTELSGHPALSVLFIDNNSTDRSHELIQQWIEDNPLIPAQLLLRESNHMAQARQQALEESASEWVAFIDADSILSPGWLQAVRKSLVSAPAEALAIGGHSVYVGSALWHPWAQSLNNYFPIGKKSSRRIPVDHIPTNNGLYRRVEVLHSGGFHPLFQRVGEDLDLSVRLRKKGVILYDPSFSVSHRLPDSLSSWMMKMSTYGRAQSYVLLKNGQGIPKEKFIPLFLCCLIFISLLLRPITSLSVLAFCFLIPRARFFLMSFCFYGLGELIGFFRYPFLKSAFN
jgi:GT2 family glycosyltransferase